MTPSTQNQPKTTGTQTTPIHDSELLQRRHLEALHRNAEAPCVSIYMPTFRSGPETEQNPIRCKNLLREAKNQLLEAGHAEGDVESMLQPAVDRLDDFSFWQHQGDGLAIFLSADSSEDFRLPFEVGELVSVGDRFHLTPLLPALSADGRFHILALSQKQVRLLEARRDTVRALDLHDIPESLRDAVGYDWEQRSLQFTSGTSPASGAGGGRRRAMFHGHGAGDDDHEAELRRFLYEIDEGVARLRGDTGTPLVVAAVEYVYAMFRDLSQQNVVADGVLGNPEHLDDRELHRRAWKLMEPRFREDEEQAASRFRELAGTDQASDELADVIPAGHAGRIDTLFVDRDSHRWGRYHLETRDIEVVGESRADTEDLVDRAAIECLFHGGDVFAVPAERMPSDRTVAATYRY